MAIYTIHGFKIGNTLIGGTSQQGLTNNFTIRNEATSGRAYPVNVGITGVRPEVDITSTSIEDVLDVMNFEGAKISSTNKVTIYAQQFKDGGTRESSGHYQLESANGLCYIDSVSWRQGENAQITFKSVLIPDNSNNPPYTMSSVSSLPALPAEDDLWSVTGITFNEVALTGFTGVTINAGITLVYEEVEGNYFPTVVAIQEYKPTISIDGNFSTSLFKALTANVASGVVTFKKRDAGPAYTEDTLQLGFYGLGRSSDGFNGSGNAISTSKFDIDCCYDGTNHPIYIVSNGG